MSFDRLAPYYGRLELVLAGNLLHRCRTAFLQQAAQSRSALLLGEGPGRYLLELLIVNPQVKVTCVDSSVRMQAIARARAEEAGFSNRGVRFVCSDWAEWQWDGNPFDLVATHFFLDCFTESELEALVAKAIALTSPNAYWVVSDFCLPSRGWKRIRAMLVLRLAYSFFRIATGLRASHIVPIAPFLRSAGFQLREQQFFNFGLIHADLWQVSE